MLEDWTYSVIMMPPIDFMSNRAAFLSLCQLRFGLPSSVAMFVVLIAKNVVQHCASEE